MNKFKQGYAKAQKEEIRFLKKIQFDNEADMGDLDEVQEMINKRLKKQIARLKEKI